AANLRAPASGGGGPGLRDDIRLSVQRAVIGALERGDLLLVVGEEVAQDFVGVLAAGGGGPDRGGKRIAKQRGWDVGDGSEPRVLDVDEYVAGRDLRVLEGGRDVVDRTRGDAARVQQREPFLGGALPEQRVEDRQQLVALAVTVGEGG